MRDERAPVLFLVLLAIVGLLVVAWGVGQEESDAADVDEGPSSQVEQGGAPAPTDVETPAASPGGDRPGPPPTASLPGGGTKVFGGHHFLV
ncbi:hypothetical protein, partial [Nocardioides sp.]|uniref:hypothetical protein n=1 Tax=Nocardioides sp. TaxID=35761 RepID=UPI0025F7BC0E